MVEKEFKQLKNTQFFVKNALFPGGHCPRGAEVGVWWRHCFHQVNFCQIQRPRPSVILHQHQIRFSINIFQTLSVCSWSLWRYKCFKVLKLLHKFTFTSSRMRIWANKGHAEKNKVKNTIFKRNYNHAKTRFSWRNG